MLKDTDKVIRMPGLAALFIWKEIELQGEKAPSISNIPGPHGAWDHVS